MAKLYFRYGTVTSAKTLNLLAVAHNYEQQNKKVYVIKPKIDTRFGEWDVKSRAGISRNADLLVGETCEINREAFRDHSCILVDEAQFLGASIINQLRDIATRNDIPVICYGLRTDFKSYLFEGSRRLMELADAIEEVKTTCQYCNRKAVFNLKLVDGKPVSEGPSVELGAEEMYLPVCHPCYQKQTGC